MSTTTTTQFQGIDQHQVHRYCDHEAGHAFIATVLGVPVDEAHVFSHMGKIGGRVWTHHETFPPAEQVAMLVGGYAAEHIGIDLDDGMLRVLHDQEPSYGGDLHLALELATWSEIVATTERVTAWLEHEPHQECLHDLGDAIRSKGSILGDEISRIARWEMPLLSV